MPLFGRPTERDEAKAAAYRQWLLRRNPFAITSTVLGVFSLTHFGTLWIDGIAAIVFGVIALRQLSARSSEQEGRGLAWLGIVTAAVSIAMAVVLYSWA